MIRTAYLPIGGALVTLPTQLGDDNATLLLREAGKLRRPMQRLNLCLIAIWVAFVLHALWRINGILDGGWRQELAAATAILAITLAIYAAVVYRLPLVIGVVTAKDPRTGRPTMLRPVLRKQAWSCDFASEPLGFVDPRTLPISILRPDRIHAAVRRIQDEVYLDGLRHEK